MTFIKKNNYIILLFIVCLIFSLIFLKDVTDSSEYVMIEVKQGDTLWGYAEEYLQYSGKTKDEFINWMVKENAIQQDMIYEGQVLLLPIKDKNKGDLLVNR